jgi:hypothetical protein
MNFTWWASIMSCLVALFSYAEYNNQGHFMSWDFELLFEKLKEKLGL